VNLLDIMTSPWAIEPRALETICAVINRRLAGEQVDLLDISAKLGRPLANEKQPITIVGGVAVIDISGPLARSMNLMHDISGGTSTQVVGAQLERAIADPSVHGIVLAIDSPGGTVAGTQELADRIYAARDTKPIVAAAANMICSAAYWIGSAASKVFLASDTDIAGSIGVVATHTDYSGRAAQLGLKISEIAAGKYKRIASEQAPLTAEGRAEIQSKVDHMYSVFVDAVARNRGVPTDTALERMADGRTFPGRQAIDAGLVDGIKTLDQVISEVSAAGARGISFAGATRVVNSGGSPGVSAPAAAAMADASALAKELAGLGLRLDDGEIAFLASGERPTGAQGISLHARVRVAREGAAGRKCSAVDAVNHVMKEFSLG